MYFEIEERTGTIWAPPVAFLLLLASFFVGAQNSILFYESLPHTIPERGIVVFYQPSCPHCIAEVPVIKELVLRGYPVYSINVLRDREIAKRYGVVVTPTILVLPHATTLVGEQDINTIISAYYGKYTDKTGEACGVETYTCGAT